MRNVCGLIAALGVALTAHGQEDLEGLFGEGFPGAAITSEYTVEYDEAEFMTGPMDSLYAYDQTLELEGKMLGALYEIEPTRSTLEVFRAYERSLTSKNFTEVFACKDDDCGGNVAYMLNTTTPLQTFQNRVDQRYGLYERTQGGAREVVMIFASKRGVSDPERQHVGVGLIALTTEAEQADLVVLDASSIAAAIETGGAAAIYGLEFNTGSAELLPASKPVLDQMAEYMTANPDVQILLVGHTDNQGGMELNMSLSGQRAQSVRAALMGDYAIAGDRLSAHGVGYLAPKATNADEAGRALNRRVEMVLR